MRINNGPASVADLLDAHKNDIEGHLYLGKAKWQNLTKKIRRQGLSQSAVFTDEQAWTFLIACGYALSGAAGMKELAKVLTGEDQVEPSHSMIWFEVLPLPPTQREGNTNVDLALGTISVRSPTKSGIQLEVAGPSWVCFCEMKFNSDIALNTTHDSNRNQLLRVIENALCLQNSGKYADKVYVTIVSPEHTVHARQPRKYEEVFDEYRNHPGSIEMHLNESHNTKREQLDWHYPGSITERIQILRLRRVTYQELFSRLPRPLESGPRRIHDAIMSFFETYAWLD